MQGPPQLRSSQARLSRLWDLLQVAYILAVNPNVLGTTGGTCTAEKDCEVSCRHRRCRRRCHRATSPRPSLLAVAHTTLCACNAHPCAAQNPSSGPVCLGNSEDLKAVYCLEQLKTNLITATAASSLISTFIIGYFANLPLALAPGMGERPGARHCGGVGPGTALRCGRALRCRRTTEAAFVMAQHHMLEGSWGALGPACRTAGMLGVLVLTVASLWPPSPCLCRHQRLRGLPGGGAVRPRRPHLQPGHGSHLCGGVDLHLAVHHGGARRHREAHAQEHRHGLLGCVRSQPWH